MSNFSCENRNNLLAAGGYAPRPRWPPASWGFAPTPPVVPPLFQILHATLPHLLNQFEQNVPLCAICAINLNNLPLVEHRAVKG